MLDSIVQFMWGYQAHYRYSLGRLAELALEAIGVSAAPEALLIGFKEAGDSTWPICVEPENRGYAPELFRDVEANADSEMLVHPEKNLFHSDSKLQERAVRRRLEGCRAELISKALQDSSKGQGRTFFVGVPRRVADFRVYPVVSVLTARWDSYPRLQHDHSDGRTHSIESIQLAVVKQVLAQGTRDLDRLSPPEDMSDLPFLLQPEVVREAVSHFVSSLIAVNASYDGTEFAEAMDAVAAQPYEGRAAFGTIVVAGENNESVVRDLTFAESVRVQETRSFRKLLEMTGPAVSLVTNGSSVSGLGRVSDSYDPESENIFTVRVLGRGSWELSHSDVPLLRIDNGAAKLPAERISRDRFVETVGRVLGDAADSEALWSQVVSAAAQQHGTMIVIHRDGVKEAARLKSQATLVEPTKLADTALSSVTAIDGAVLLLPDASCVAVGVILDGLASPGAGDKSRGARFNSGVRYQLSAPPSTCVVVIVSEDGMINLLPDLPRRVKPSSVEDAVAKLEEASREPVDFEIASKCANYAESVAFYMTSDQCNRVNAAQEKIEQARGRSRSALVPVGFDLLEPNPDMNETYFLDED